MCDVFQKALLIQEDAAKLGFDWPDISGVLDKVEEETGEIREALENNDIAHAQKELGDLLFAAINLARFLKVDPADMLDQTNQRFSLRFSAVCRAVEEKGISMEMCTLEELETIWQQVKKSLA